MASAMIELDWPADEVASSGNWTVGNDDSIPLSSLRAGDLETALVRWRRRAASAALVAGSLLVLEPTAISAAASAPILQPLPFAPVQAMRRVMSLSDARADALRVLRDAEAERNELAADEWRRLASFHSDE